MGWKKNQIFPYYPGSFTQPKQFFKYSGRKDCPRNGEYFLSGAIPTVYKAEDDLDTLYHIMVEVEEPPKEIYAHGCTYRRTFFP